MSHRVTEDWMGEPVETLEDLLRAGLYAVCVGINPSPVSVEQGHYYRGRLGQQFYSRLRSVGLLPHDAAGWEDDALFELGVGFTDIIKRATVKADKLLRSEFEHGRPLLRRKLDEVCPALVIFTFPKTARALFGEGTPTGFFDPDSGDDVSYFAMPGPYEETTRRDALLDELKRFVVGEHGRRPVSRMPHHGDHAH